MLLGAVCAAAEEVDSPSVQANLSADARRAIDAGLSYLVRTQNEDGSWMSDGSTGRYPVAITALAGLALLASGDTCYSGPHSPNLRRAVTYLVQQADPKTGLIGSGQHGRPMFGHGYAMLFLAQVYGSEGQPALRKRVRHVLRGAVELTARSQNSQGGWYYTPDSDKAEGAVTMTQMQGLRACANAGLSVPSETVKRALDYIRRSARPDGGIAYKVDQPGGSRPPITCAAVATMYAAGIYKGELVEGALRYATRSVPTTGSTPVGGGHFYWAHLYLSQALYLRGGEAWNNYFDQLSAWLVSAQDKQGAWNGDYIGRGYGTAVALLILQLPCNNLPILQP
ncbi:MAG: terpene cyclase/mutase family protein [Planctomycetes bacterium]|nr:terpene cyclase/mutase family protein [Planctomycetota bacterium]